MESEMVQDPLGARGLTGSRKKVGLGELFFGFGVSFSNFLEFNKPEDCVF